MTLPGTTKEVSPTRTSSTLTSRSDESSIRTVSVHDYGESELRQTPATPGPDSRSIRPQLSRQATSIKTCATSDPAFEVDFDGEDDRDNPRNWPLWYRGLIIGLLSFSTWVVVLYSTDYTSGMPEMMEEFGIQSTSVGTLGLTTYLFGLAVGSVVLAPLSEVYGRRPVYIGSMVVFTIFVLPCALAKSLQEVLILRFLGALAGSVMIANAPGSLSDIVDDEHRALAFSLWSIAPMNGPVSGPIIGGFVTQDLGWRWTNWLVLIFAGVALAFVAFIPETYSPTILRKKARRIRKKTGEDFWWSRYDQKMKLWPLLRVNLSRPFVMSVTEPICVFWELYIATVYAILYLCFVAYPIVFSDIRGWGPGLAGLAFVGIGVGTLLAIFVEPLLRRMINAHKPDPETGKPPAEAAVSVVCIAAVLAPAGQLWFAWTCAPKTIHWAWAIVAGIPFGAGNTLIFIYGSNYLAHSYGIYAASALAGNTVARSVVGGVLPLAGPSLYRALGPNWAGTLLGLLEVMLIPIPFVFYKFGHKIRRRSPLIQEMQRDKERQAGKRAKYQEKLKGQSEEGPHDAP
ncbi:MAG: hypothetical protein M1817_004346 [Caeruleum heppii]|nr:MAG: hypothetical protein M1817_004346 [Caeruleum heppii]